MAVYTVHEPLPRKHEDATPPERIRFVRDGFYFWAFLLGPLWMLWHGLWLVFLLYLLGTSVLQIALWAVGASVQVKFAAGVLVAVLVGLEAGTLRRWSLYRMRERGVIVAPNLETAERRFFELQAAGETSWQPAVPAQPMHVQTSDADVIGLFPQPEPRR
jgi:hypothetical protein